MRPRLCALLAGVAAMSGLAVGAGPAVAACTCSEGELARNEQLARTAKVAVLQRIDRDDGQADREIGFRVAATNDPKLSTQLYGNVEQTPCGEEVRFGTVFATLVEDGTWVPCGRLDLQRTLDRIDGPRKPVHAGPVVAVAAGDYGTESLVGLNAAGEPVVWGASPDAVQFVQACPGGRTVVLVGREGDDGPRRFDVVDASTLRVRRTVLAPPGVGFGLEAVNCADPEGRQVTLFYVGASSGGASGEIGPVEHGVVQIENGEVRDLPLEPGPFIYYGAVAHGSGFLAIQRVNDEPLRLVRVSSNGDPEEVRRYSEFDYLGDPALSPDGRTLLAMVNVRDRDGSDRVDFLTLDATTGKVLARGGVPAGPGVPTGVEKLAWTASGRVLASTATDTQGGPTSPTPDRVLEFDASLRLIGERSSGPLVAVVGDSAVQLTGMRLGYVNVGFLPRDLDVRLTGTVTMVGLSAAGFASAPAAPQPTSTESGRVAVLFLAGIAAVAGAAVGARALRARRSVAPR